MHRTCAKVLAVVAVLGAAAFLSSVAAESTVLAKTGGADSRGEVSFKVPVLTVNARTGGGYHQLPFSLGRRAGDDAPLKVLVADDTPLGAGKSIRSSVWLAAVTAAMLRGDSMNGVRVTVEFSGYVDGPSAGGVVCLAILSALEGKTIPADFAMTGTIMPDGTIGAVGGVPKKLKAAIASGCKRICIPSSVRFEQDGDELVDLFRIGAKEGVEVRPVASIDEAYAFCHAQKPPRVEIIDEGRTLSLPRGAEDRLLAAIRRSEKNIRELRGALDAGTVENLKADDFYHDRLFDTGFLRQLATGQLLTAWENVKMQEAMWQSIPAWAATAEARVKGCPALAKAGQRTAAERAAVAKAIGLFQQEFAKQAEPLFDRANLDGYSQASGYVRTGKDYGEISAQAEEDGENSAAAAGTLYFLNALSTRSEELGKADDETLTAAFELEMYKELVRLACGRIMDGEQELPPLMTMFANYPKPAPSERLGSACRLFHSAWTAVDASLDADVIRDSSSDDEGGSGEEKLAALTLKDAHFATYRFAKNRSSVTYRWLDNREKLGDPVYHESAQLVLDAKVLASACTFLIKYGVDVGGHFDESGTYRCRHPEFFNHLVRRARQTALAAIAACRKANIPCPLAIAAFEAADGCDVSSSDADTVMHEILENYWSAGMTAKALLIGFAKGRH